MKLANARESYDSWEHALGQASPGNVADARTSLSYDILIAALLFVCSFCLYRLLGLGIAAGAYLDYYNLAFDFDPQLYVSTFVSEPANKVGFKHPLIIVARPVGQFLLALGLSPKDAAVTVMCFFGSLTNVVVWLFLRFQHIDRALAVLLTILFAISSTTVVTAIVPESYGISNFAIALTWLLALSCMRAAAINRLAPWRLVSGILLTGTTITNVVQFAIAEFFMRWQYLRGKAAFQSAFRTCCVLLILFVMACFVVWNEEIIRSVQDPVAALKQIYWLRTKGERTGLLDILQTFFVYSFVAPEFSFITLTHDQAGKVVTTMWDFREWNFKGIGLAAAWIWLAGLVGGVVLAFRDSVSRKLYLGIAAALAFNVVFHLDFQFRGSLYLYAAHAHFLVFALFAKSASFVTKNGWSRTAYMGLLTVLVVLVAANNLPLLEKFSTGFAHPMTTCVAPCA